MPSCYSGRYWGCGLARDVVDIFLSDGGAGIAFPARVA
jgi:hypothetical protein